MEVDKDAAILPKDQISDLQPIRMVDQIQGNWTNLLCFICLKGGAYSFNSQYDQNEGQKHTWLWLVLHLLSTMDNPFLTF